MNCIHTCNPAYVIRLGVVATYFSATVASMGDQA